MVLIAVVRLVLSVPRYGRTAVPLGTQARFSRGVVQLYENKRHRMVVSNPSARFAYFLAIRNKQSALGNLKRPSSVSCSRTYALNLVWIRILVLYPGTAVQRLLSEVYGAYTYRMYSGIVVLSWRSVLCARKRLI